MRLLRRHVGLCLDTCHFAVEFEDPLTALIRFESACIRVARVQLSAAIRTVVGDASLARLADFHARNAAVAPAMLAKLQQTVIENGNVFAVLMEAVRVCSLGQITQALFEVGGQYRRSM